MHNVLIWDKSMPDVPPEEIDRVWHGSRFNADVTVKIVGQKGGRPKYKLVIIILLFAAKYISALVHQ